MLFLRDLFNPFKRLNTSAYTKSTENFKAIHHLTALQYQISANMKKKRSDNSNKQSFIRISTGPSVGLLLNKKRGQHLLKNPGVLDKIVVASDIRSSDIVLEIGPGTGNLTVKLLPLAKKVVVIDIDERMVNEVKKRALSNGLTNLETVHGDALRSEFGRFDVCTANLPYQISSPFLFKLLSHKPIFRCAVLMFQKEFADRLLAEPNDKNYGRLAINTRLFCKVTRVCKVSAGSFNPPPKVDSVVVKLIPRNPPLNIDFNEWDGLIRICFSRKKKTLHAIFNQNSTLNMLETNYKTFCSLNSIKPSTLSFKELCLGILESTGLSNSRSITIDIESFFKLLLAFNREGIHFMNLVGNKQNLNNLSYLEEDAADDPDN